MSTISNTGDFPPPLATPPASKPTTPHPPSRTDDAAGTIILSKYGEKRVPDGQAVLENYKDVMGNDWAKETNPNGYINLAVAENTVVWEHLKRVFEKNFALRRVDFTYGDNLQGSIRLRHALAKLFNNHFSPHSPVSPDDLLTGAGLLPLIAQLGRALVDPGAGILLAAPYYHGFDAALATQGGIHLVGVPVPPSQMFDDTPTELTHFETALADSNARGIPIQAVILCNPQNPYGRCYTRGALERYARFCERHNLHLISDEIYALSTFASEDLPDPTPFTSILSIDLEKIGVSRQRVHMLYGMSKDFGANGFRAGVLHSWNTRLLTSLAATTLFMLVSSPAAGLWYSILDDERELQEFLALNRRVLKESYERMTGWLKFHRIPYLPAEAGQFVMADFRPLLESSAYNSNAPSLAGGQSETSRLRFSPNSSLAERESAFTAFLNKEVKVVMGKGTAFHMYEPGWMRITFSVDRERVDLALRRVEDALGWERWDGLRSGGKPRAVEAGGSAGTVEAALHPTAACLECREDDGTLKGCGPR